MSNLKTLPLQLDREHCQAICEEVAERLRLQLDRETSDLPPRLQLLLERFIELDLQATPSIVPAMDDMTACPVAA